MLTLGDLVMVIQLRGDQANEMGNKLQTVDLGIATCAAGTTQTDCQNCTAGNKHVSLTGGTTCTACTWYILTRLQTACKHCPVGKYGILEGGTNVSVQMQQLHYWAVMEM